MSKGTIFIKNSSKTVNFGKHNLDVIIRTDGGRISTDVNYVAIFEVDYGKHGEKSNLKLIIREENNLR